MILVNDRDKVEWSEGMTIDDLLVKMGYTYALITVTIDGLVIQKEDYDSFAIPDEAKVIIFHLAHGG